MAAIGNISYRSFDELLDDARLDLQSFNSAGDIDASVLIKVAQRINYELGLKIHSMKETMLEVEHHRAKLPADFHQSLLTLICHQWKHVQNAPWNGNVLLEQVQPNTCPCWTITSTGVQTLVHYCDGTTAAVYFPPNDNGSPRTTKLCATSIDSHVGLTLTTTSFCPEGSGNIACDNCELCNVTHDGPCPELVINPYPLGKTRTLCNDTVNIRILQYCSSEVRCYEQFERLYIEPHIQASAFSTQGQFRSQHNRGSISSGFLYTEGMECGKVYIYYLGGLEDEDGNLLVLDHPQINNYYTWALKHAVLENLYLNGEDLLQRLQYAEKKVEEYRDKALSIANMPNMREVLKTLSILKDNHDRQYYHPLSRWHGYLGIANPVDNYSQY